MFFRNRRKPERDVRATEQTRQKATAVQDAEQLRLGKILYEALKPLAEQNTQVHGGTISAGYLERNAGNYSVIISYHSGSHQESMMQFDIDLVHNRLSTGWKYKDGPEFTADQFEQFLETAKQMVRDFK